MAPTPRVGLIVGFFLKRVTLFAPWVCMIVIAAHFPKSTPVPIAELERSDPLGAFPRVEFRYHEPQRPAMVRFQLAPIVPMRKYHIIVEELTQRQIGCVSAIAMHNDESNLGREGYQPHQVIRLDAVPGIVEARPGRYAVKITHLARLRQRVELLVVESKLGFYQSDHPEIPFRAIETRSRTIA